MGEKNSLVSGDACLPGEEKGAVEKRPEKAKRAVAVVGVGGRATGQGQRRRVAACRGVAVRSRDAHDGDGGLGAVRPSRVETRKATAVLARRRR
ncbi:unnamed protein product [Urochloa humidicola]